MARAKQRASTIAAADTPPAGTASQNTSAPAAGREGANPQEDIEAASATGGAGAAPITTIPRSQVELLTVAINYQLSEPVEQAESETEHDKCRRLPTAAELQHDALLLSEHEEEKQLLKAQQGRRGATVLLAQRQGLCKQRRHSKEKYGQRKMRHQERDEARQQNKWQRHEPQQHPLLPPSQPDLTQQQCRHHGRPVRAHPRQRNLVAQQQQPDHEEDLQKCHQQQEAAEVQAERVAGLEHHQQSLMADCHLQIGASSPFSQQQRTALPDATQLQPQAWPGQLASPEQQSSVYFRQLCQEEASDQSAEKFSILKKQLPGELQQRGVPPFTNFQLAVKKSTLQQYPQEPQIQQKHETYYHLQRLAREEQQRPKQQEHFPQSHGCNKTASDKMQKKAFVQGCAVKIDPKWHAVKQQVHMSLGGVQQQEAKGQLRPAEHRWQAQNAQQEKQHHHHQLHQSEQHQLHREGQLPQQRPKKQSHEDAQGEQERRGNELQKNERHTGQNQEQYRVQQQQMWQREPYESQSQHRQLDSRGQRQNDRAQQRPSAEEPQEEQQQRQRTPGTSQHGRRENGFEAAEELMQLLQKNQRLLRILINLIERFVLHFHNWGTIGAVSESAFAAMEAPPKLPIATQSGATAGEGMPAMAPTPKPASQELGPGKVATPKAGRRTGASPAEQQATATGASAHRENRSDTFWFAKSKFSFSSHSLASNSVQNSASKMARACDTMTDKRQTPGGVKPLSCGDYESGSNAMDFPAQRFLAAELGAARKLPLVAGTNGARTPHTEKSSSLLTARLLPKQAGLAVEDRRTGAVILADLTEARSVVLPAAAAIQLKGLPSPARGAPSAGAIQPLVKKATTAAVSSTFMVSESVAISEKCRSIQTALHALLPQRAVEQHAEEATAGRALKGATKKRSKLSFLTVKSAAAGNIKLSEKAEQHLEGAGRHAQLSVLLQERSMAVSQTTAAAGGPASSIAAVVLCPQRGQIPKEQQKNGQQVQGKKGNEEEQPKLQQQKEQGEEAQQREPLMLDDEELQEKKHGPHEEVVSRRSLGLEVEREGATDTADEVNTSPAANNCTNGATYSPFSVAVGALPPNFIAPGPVELAAVSSASAATTSVASRSCSAAHCSSSNELHVCVNASATSGVASVHVSARPAAAAAHVTTSAKSSTRAAAALHAPRAFASSACNPAADAAAAAALETKTSATATMVAPEDTQRLCSANTGEQIRQTCPGTAEAEPARWKMPELPFEGETKTTLQLCFEDCSVCTTSASCPSTSPSPLLLATGQSPLPASSSSPSSPLFQRTPLVPAVLPLLSADDVASDRETRAALKGKHFKAHAYSGKNSQQQQQQQQWGVNLPAQQQQQPTGLLPIRQQKPSCLMASSIWPPQEVCHLVLPHVVKQPSALLVGLEHDKQPSRLPQCEQQPNFVRLQMSHAQQSKQQSASFASVGPLQQQEIIPGPALLQQQAENGLLQLQQRRQRAADMLQWRQRIASLMHQQHTETCVKERATLPKVKQQPAVLAVAVCQLLVSLQRLWLRVLVHVLHDAGFSKWDEVSRSSVRGENTDSCASDRSNTGNNYSRYSGDGSCRPDRSTCICTESNSSISSWRRGDSSSSSTALQAAPQTWLPESSVAAGPWLFQRPAVCLEGTAANSQEGATTAAEDWAAAAAAAGDVLLSPSTRLQPGQLKESSYGKTRGFASLTQTLCKACEPRPQSQVIDASSAGIKELRVTTASPLQTSDPGFSTEGPLAIQEGNSEAVNPFARAVAAPSAFVAAEQRAHTERLAAAFSGAPAPLNAAGLVAAATSDICAGAAESIAETATETAAAAAVEDNGTAAGSYAAATAQRRPAPFEEDAAVAKRSAMLSNIEKGVAENNPAAACRAADNAEVHIFPPTAALAEVSKFAVDGVCTARERGTAGASAFASAFVTAAGGVETGLRSDTQTISHIVDLIGSALASICRVNACVNAPGPTVASCPVACVPSALGDASSRAAAAAILLAAESASGALKHLLAASPAAAPAPPYETTQNASATEAVANRITGERAGSDSPRSEEATAKGGADSGSVPSAARAVVRAGAGAGFFQSSGAVEESVVAATAVVPTSPAAVDEKVAAPAASPISPPDASIEAAASATATASAHLAANKYPRLNSKLRRRTLEKSWPSRENSCEKCGRNFVDHLAKATKEMQQGGGDSGCDSKGYGACFNTCRRGRCMLCRHGRSTCSLGRQTPCAGNSWSSFWDCSGSSESEEGSSFNPVPSVDDNCKREETRSDKGLQEKADSAASKTTGALLKCTDSGNEALFYAYSAAAAATTEHQVLTDSSGALTAINSAPLNGGDTNSSSDSLQVFLREEEQPRDTQAVRRRRQRLALQQRRRRSLLLLRGCWVMRLLPSAYTRSNKSVPYKSSAQTEGNKISLQYNNSSSSRSIVRDVGRDNDDSGAGEVSAAARAIFQPHLQNVQLARQYLYVSPDFQFICCAGKPPPSAATADLEEVAPPPLAAFHDKRQLLLQEQQKQLHAQGQQQHLQAQQQPDDRELREKQQPLQRPHSGAQQQQPRQHKLRKHMRHAEERQSQTRPEQERQQSPPQPKGDNRALAQQRKHQQRYAPRNTQGVQNVYMERQEERRLQQGPHLQKERQQQQLLLQRNQRRRIDLCEVHPTGQQQQHASAEYKTEEQQLGCAKNQTQEQQRQEACTGKGEQEQQQQTCAGNKKEEQRRQKEKPRSNWNGFPTTGSFARDVRETDAGEVPLLKAGTAACSPAGKGEGKQQRSSKRRVEGPTAIAALSSDDVKGRFGQQWSSGFSNGLRVSFPFCGSHGEHCSKEKLPRTAARRSRRGGRVESGEEGSSSSSSNRETVKKQEEGRSGGRYEENQWDYKRSSNSNSDTGEKYAAKAAGESGEHDRKAAAHINCKVASSTIVSPSTLQDSSSTAVPLSSCEKLSMSDVWIDPCSKTCARSATGRKRAFYRSSGRQLAGRRRSRRSNSNLFDLANVVLGYGCLRSSCEVAVSRRGSLKSNNKEGLWQRPAPILAPTSCAWLCSEEPAFRCSKEGCHSIVHDSSSSSSTSSNDRGSCQSGNSGNESGSGSSHRGNNGNDSSSSHRGNSSNDSSGSHRGNNSNDSSSSSSAEEKTQQRWRPHQKLLVQMSKETQSDAEALLTSRRHADQPAESDQQIQQQRHRQMRTGGQLLRGARQEHQLLNRETEQPQQATETALRFADAVLSCVLPLSDSSYNRKPAQLRQEQPYCAATHVGTPLPLPPAAPAAALATQKGFDTATPTLAACSLLPTSASSEATAAALCVNKAPGLIQRELTRRTSSKRAVSDLKVCETITEKPPDAAWAREASAVKAAPVADSSGVEEAAIDNSSNGGQRFCESRTSGSRDTPISSLNSSSSLGHDSRCSGSASTDSCYLPSSVVRNEVSNATVLQEHDTAYGPEENCSASAAPAPSATTTGTYTMPANMTFSPDFNATGTPSFTHANDICSAVLHPSAAAALRNVVSAENQRFSSAAPAAANELQGVRKRQRKRFCAAYLQRLAARFALRGSASAAEAGFDRASHTLQSLLVAAPPRAFFPSNATRRVSADAARKQESHKQVGGALCLQRETATASPPQELQANTPLVIPLKRVCSLEYGYRSSTYQQLQDSGRSSLQAIPPYLCCSVRVSLLEELLDTNAAASPLNQPLLQMRKKEALHQQEEKQQNLRKKRQLPQTTAPQIVLDFVALTAADAARWVIGLNGLIPYSPKRILYTEEEVMKQVRVMRRQQKQRQQLECFLQHYREGGGESAAHKGRPSAFRSTLLRSESEGCLLDRHACRPLQSKCISSSSSSHLCTQARRDHLFCKTSSFSSLCRNVRSNKSLRYGRRLHCEGSAQYCGSLRTETEARVRCEDRCLPVSTDQNENDHDTEGSQSNWGDSSSGGKAFPHSGGRTRSSSSSVSLLSRQRGSGEGGLIRCNSLRGSKSTYSAGQHCAQRSVHDHQRTPPRRSGCSRSSSVGRSYRSTHNTLKGDRSRDSISTHVKKRWKAARVKLHQPRTTSDKQRRRISLYGDCSGGNAFEEEEEEEKTDEKELPFSASSAATMQRQRPHRLETSPGVLHCQQSPAALRSRVFTARRRNNSCVSPLHIPMCPAGLLLPTLAGDNNYYRSSCGSSAEGRCPHIDCLHAIPPLSTQNSAHSCTAPPFTAEDALDKNLQHFTMAAQVHPTVQGKSLRAASPFRRCATTSECYIGENCVATSEPTSTCPRLAVCDLPPGAAAAEPESAAESGKKRYAKRKLRRHFSQNLLRLATLGWGSKLRGCSHSSATIGSSRKHDSKCIHRSREGNSNSISGSGLCDSVSTTCSSSSTRASNCSKLTRSSSAPVHGCSHAPAADGVQCFSCCHGAPVTQWAEHRCHRLHCCWYWSAEAAGARDLDVARRSRDTDAVDASAAVAASSMEEHTEQQGGAQQEQHQQQTKQSPFLTRYSQQGNLDEQQPPQEESAEQQHLGRCLQWQHRAPPSPQLLPLYAVQKEWQQMNTVQPPLPVLLPTEKKCIRCKTLSLFGLLHPSRSSCSSGSTRCKLKRDLDSSTGSPVLLKGITSAPACTWQAVQLTCSNCACTYVCTQRQQHQRLTKQQRQERVPQEQGEEENLDKRKEEHGTRQQEEHQRQQVEENEQHQQQWWRPCSSDRPCNGSACFPHLHQISCFACRYPHSRTGSCIERARSSRPWSRDFCSVCNHNTSHSDLSVPSCWCGSTPSYTNSTCISNNTPMSTSSCSSPYHGRTLSRDDSSWKVCLCSPKRTCSCLPHHRFCSSWYRDVTLTDSNQELCGGVTTSCSAVTEGTAASPTAGAATSEYSFTPAADPSSASSSAALTQAIQLKILPLGGGEDFSIQLHQQRHSEQLQGKLCGQQPLSQDQQPQEEHQQELGRHGKDVAVGQWQRLRPADQPQKYGEVKEPYRRQQKDQHSSSQEQCNGQPQESRLGGERKQKVAGVIDKTEEEEDNTVCGLHPQVYGGERATTDGRANEKELTAGSLQDKEGAEAEEEEDDNDQEAVLFSIY